MKYTENELATLLSQTTHFLSCIQQEKKLNVDDISALSRVIEMHEYFYYVCHEPKISDYDFDQLFRALVTVENEHPSYIVPSSPTQRVAKDTAHLFQPTPHLVPMLSLQNTYNAAELQAWHKKNEDAISKQKSNLLPLGYTIEPKFDGTSISLVYENDILLRAVTRGDGLVGEDVTQNMKQLKSIPLYAPFSTLNISVVEIRGEILMSKNNFKKVNALLMAQNESPFINPRNAASGSMRLKNSNDIKHRQLEGIMYHISYIQKKDNTLDTPIHTHQDEIDVLQKMGFKTVHQHFFITQDLPQILSYCAAFENQKNDLDFEIDGLVLKVNALPAQDILGMTSHHPRWAVAYKFKPDQVESRLESVDFQVGRTGVITPVAKIKPVYVGGVTVSSISLFNEENIKEKNLHVGDIVVIERAGEVIPYIVKNVSTQWQPDAVAITFPKNCPSCGVGLMKSEQEANWRCTNAECTEQNIQKIIYFCSKEAMDIQFLGEAKVRQFYELGWLKTVPDIYRLPYHLMQQLDGWGAKSIANLQSAIEHSLSNPLHKIILGLGIPYVGKSTALTLCRHIQHLEELATISEEQLQQWEDIGPKVAQSISQFFRHPYHQNMLSQLRDSGLSFNNTQRQTQHQSGSLSHLTFLFTGTLSTMKRSTAEELVKQNGGEIVGSVSSKLHYLVVGDDAGSKLEKAKKMNTIRIITEAEFIGLIAAYQHTQNKDHKNTPSS